MELGFASEKLRKQLLEEELNLRKKQPQHWAKTKYRKYAKPYTDAELEKIKELEKKRKARTRKSSKKPVKKTAKKKVATEGRTREGAKKKTAKKKTKTKTKKKLKPGKKKS